MVRHSGGASHCDRLPPNSYASSTFRVLPRARAALSSGLEGNGNIGRIKESVQCRAAGVHLFGHGGLSLYGNSPSQGVVIFTFSRVDPAFGSSLVLHII